MILKPLEVLYNFSFSSGTVPDAFKIACVIPVYKAKSCLSLTNYRPISLLSIFTQILEKLMYNRLIKYLDKHNIIFSWQFGFCVNHSTEHQDAKKVSFTACHSGRAFRQAVATVSVKIVGTLLCLLVPSVLVYKVWWLNRDKQLWEGQGEHEKEKNSVWFKCPNYFCLRLCWGGIWRRVDRYGG